MKRPEFLHIDANFWKLKVDLKIWKMDVTTKSKEL